MDKEKKNDKHVDTSLWDEEKKAHANRVYFNKPQLLTQYIGAKTTVIVAGRRTARRIPLPRLLCCAICNVCQEAREELLCRLSSMD